MIICFPQKIANHCNLIINLGEMDNQYQQQWQQYQPPSMDVSSDALYRGNRMYNNQGPRAEDHWGQVNKQKSKHYNDLTAYLCIVFSV